MKRKINNFKQKNRSVLNKLNSKLLKFTIDVYVRNSGLLFVNLIHGKNFYKLHTTFLLFDVEYEVFAIQASYGYEQLLL